MIDNNEVQRIPTKIYGLDKLLYGGLDIIKRPFTIIIRGGAGTESTLFCLQMMYGIALSLNDQNRKTPFDTPVIPYYFSSCHRKEDIETLMIDTFISSCIYSMTKKIIDKSYGESDLSIFTKSLFETSKIICNTDPMPNTPKIPIKDIKTRPDQLIAESAMYYNNRTRALHFRTENSVADLSNMVFKRSYDSINAYVDYDLENENVINNMLERSLQTKLIKTSILPFDSLSQTNDLVLMSLEIDNTKDYSINEMRELITRLKQTSQISILVVDEETKIPANYSDILIDLYNKTKNGYVLHYMNMTHNSHQYSVLGEHQYKRRDFGIEVFPSIHTYFKKKKNFHRSLVYTHSSIIEDTYPQYLSRKVHLHQEDVSYDDFFINKDKYIEENMKALHPFDNVCR